MYLEIWEQDTMKQKWKKSKKNPPEKNKKPSQNDSQKQKSYQRNKYLGNLFLKVLKTIEINKEGTQKK